MGNVEIRKLVDMRSLKKPSVVLGFPGTGLVGSVAASQMVDALQMSFGGYISSSEFAPLAAIHNYKPMPAARIHFSEKFNLVVIISEMTIPVASSLEVANKVYDFAKSLNAARIICLGGISLKESGSDVYAVSSDPILIRDAVSKKIAKPIREGATSGVTGILLTRGALDNFPITALLAESSEEYLDPGAAVNALKVFSKITGLQISTTSLEKEAREASKGLRESMIKARLSKKKGPTAEEAGSMFG